MVVSVATLILIGYFGVIGFALLLTGGIVALRYKPPQITPQREALQIQNHLTWEWFVREAIIDRANEICEDEEGQLVLLTKDDST